jgi:hypothetical protein
MSRSEPEARRTEVATVGSDVRPVPRPLDPIERAFRWIVDYRSQPSFEHVPDRVAA